MHRDAEYPGMNLAQLASSVKHAIVSIADKEGTNA